MAVFNANTQTLAANEVVIFQNTTCKCNANIKHNSGNGVFSLKGSGNCCNPARYRVAFHGVFTTTGTDPIRLALVVDGEYAPSDIISTPPVAAGTVLDGTIVTDIVVNCCCSKVAVRALTAVPLTAGRLIIDRIA